MEGLEKVTIRFPGLSEPIETIGGAGDRFGVNAHGQGTFLLAIDVKGEVDGVAGKQPPAQVHAFSRAKSYQASIEVLPHTPLHGVRHGLPSCRPQNTEKYPNGYEDQHPPLVRRPTRQRLLATDLDGPEDDLVFLEELFRHRTAEDDRVRREQALVLGFCLQVVPAFLFPFSTCRTPYSPRCRQ